MSGRIRTSVLSAAVLAAVAGSAGAQLISYDGFNYLQAQQLRAVGNGGLGWAFPWNAAGAGPWIVDSSGSHYVKGFRVLSTSGYRIFSSGAVDQRTMQLGGPLGTPGTSVWVSFIAQQTAGTSANSWLGVKLPCTGPNAFLFLGKPFNRTNWGTDAGSIASHRQTATPSIRKSFIVARIDFKAGNDDVHVWVDPSLGGTPSNASAALQLPNYGDFSGITKVLTESGWTTGGGPISGNIDEIRVGGEFVDVAPRRGTRLFKGLIADPIGQSQLSEDNATVMQVSHIGGTGQDGVRLHATGGEGVAATIDAGPIHLTGGVVTSAILDANGGLIGTQRLTSTGDGSVTIDYDFSAIGADALEFTAYDEAGNVVGSGVSADPTWSARANIYCPPGWTPTFSSSWVTITHCCPFYYWSGMQLTFTGCTQTIHWSELGNPLMFASLDIRPIGGTATGAIGSLDMTAAGIGGLSVLDAAGMVSGVGVTGQGNAVVDLSEAGTAKIHNIDETWISGAVMKLPRDRRVAFDADFGPVLAENGVAKAEIRSPLSPTEEFTLASLEIIGASEQGTVAPDFSGMGATGYTITAYDEGGSIVAQTTKGNGDPVTFRQICPPPLSPIWGWVYCGQCVTPWLWRIVGCSMSVSWDLTNYHNGHTFTIEPFGGVIDPEVSSVGVGGSNLSSSIVISNIEVLSRDHACPADYNADGFVDFFDIDAFVFDFENGSPGADFNADGFIDFFDLDLYVETFEAGC